MRTVVPYPRDLRANEILVIEKAYKGQGRKQWRPSGEIYPAGCEHDAHGVCVVRNNYAKAGEVFRLSIYKRSKS